MSQKLRHLILFFAGSFACLYLAFSAVTTIPYVNHDTIRYFHKFYNKESDAGTNPQYHWDYSIGRPLYAEFESFIYKKVDHLSDMSRLRLMTIAVSALSAAVLGVIFISMGLEAIAAFCLSTAIFTLPGIQEFIFVPFLSNALAIFFSLLAYFVWSGSLMYTARLILTFALLEGSFFTYPPAVFFFLVPAAVIIILRPDDWPSVKKIWIRDLILWGVSAAVYYLSLKLFFYTSLKSSGHEISFPAGQILTNIKTFFPDGVAQTFNLWNIYYSRMLGISIMAFIGICLLTDFFISRKSGQRMLALIAVFLVCNMVWFTFGGYLPRTFIASQAIALALVYWCGQRIWNSRYWAFVFLFIGLISANRIIVPNVWNNNAELMFVRSRLIEFVNSSTKEIHVVMLKDGSRGYNGLMTVYDNFNSTTPPYEVPDLIRVALKELPDPFELHCRVVVSKYGEPFTLSPQGVIMDMNDLAYISRIKSR